MQTTLGFRSQPRPEFEKGPVPYLLKEQMLQADLPTDATVEHAVQGFFAELDPTVRNIMMVVAVDLIRNAQWHGKAPAEQIQPGPALTLTLGRVTDEQEMVTYPLIRVADLCPWLPEAQRSHRTGLWRVISLTHRCGALRTGSGKHVWALVDPQPR